MDEGRPDFGAQDEAERDWVGAPDESDDEVFDDDLEDEEELDDDLEDEEELDDEGAEDLDEGDEPPEPGDEELEGEDEGEGDQADETEFATVASGSTLEAAKAKALEQLRKVVPYVNEADVEFIVLDEGGQGGFLGMGKSHPRVEARLRPGRERADEDLAPAGEQLREFLEHVTAEMGLDVAVEIDETPEAIVADIAGDDLGILIGRHGQTLDALQYIAAIAVNGRRQHRRQVVVDAEGYRERRESSLKSLADRTAQRVSRERQEIALKPMTAAERKIVHIHLKDHPRVETASQGDEPYRKVVISPKRKHPQQ